MFWWQKGFFGSWYLLLFVSGCEENPVDVKVWPEVVRVGRTEGPMMVSCCYFLLLRCSGERLLDLFPATGDFPVVDLEWFMFPIARRIRWMLWSGHRQPGLAVQLLENWQCSALRYFGEKFLSYFSTTWGSSGHIFRLGFVDSYEMSIFS